MVSRHSIHYPNLIWYHQSAIVWKRVLRLCSDFRSWCSLTLVCHYDFLVSIDIIDGTRFSKYQDADCPLQVAMDQWPHQIIIWSPLRLPLANPPRSILSHSKLHAYDLKKKNHHIWARHNCCNHFKLSFFNRSRDHFGWKHSRSQLWSIMEFMVTTAPLEAVVNSRINGVLCWILWPL